MPPKQGSSSASPLASIVALVGATMEPDNLENQAAAIEQLSMQTGYKSLFTFAQAFRELAQDIRKDME